MKTEELKLRLLNACKEIENAEEELTAIDSKFGDADHGLTMRKVAEAIKEAVQNYSEHSIKGLLNSVAENVGKLNGGSAIPLWTSFLQGIADVAEEGDKTDLQGIQKMFENGFEEFDFMSGAKVGDKTMMDAMAPAIEAISNANDENTAFTAAAEAARNGAEETRNHTARFGRAKSFGDKTIGTCDAGALSLACFFKGLAEQ